MATTAQNNQSMNMFGMVMVAAAAGALAGLLFAPKRGSEMRDDINRRMMDMKSKTQEKVNQGADTMKIKAQDVADRTRATINRGADKASDIASDAADKAKTTTNRAAEATKEAARETAADARRRSTAA